MKFFISDTHFGHANVIKFDNRPFANVDEMDERMIKLWNETVKPNDEVYHLGDVAFHTAERAEKIIKRLNGHKHLIFGNHDKVVRNNRAVRDLFASTREYHEVREKELRFCLFHYPIGEWNQAHRGAYHQHGHCHGNYEYPREGKIMDVGACCIGYKPISLDEVVERLKHKPNLEHH